MKKNLDKLSAFKIPLIVVIGIILYLALNFIFNLHMVANIIILVSILVGTYKMFLETISSLLKKQFALDYIAIIAIVVSIITQQYFVGAVLALMIATGTTLEDYGVAKAKKSLTQLVDRIPTDITLWEKERAGRQIKLENVNIGDQILIRKGEVIGLDGELISDIGETDESSLTGEPYFIGKVKGDLIRSGTVNIGQLMVIKVTKTEKDSTYKKIIEMVKRAEQEKSPMIRLADKYSTIFTIITFVIAFFAFVYSHFSLSTVLAVLAVATPCPLIIATPIALLGGMNASGKRKIIIKKLEALEALSRITTIAFDKTGTITLGKPKVIKIDILDKNYTEKEILKIAEAIERNSLHPLAKAITQAAKEKKIFNTRAESVKEIIGKGISGIVEKKEYLLAKMENTSGMSIELKTNKKQIAIFYFEDEIKESSKKTIKNLKNIGLELHIYTGDKKTAAEKVVSQLGENVVINAECTPQDKQDKIKALKENGRVVAMVGDGINDAPALALADVGMAFSDSEQTAASEAADIIFLGGDFSMVFESWKIAKRTIAIAKQSIMWGIGLSLVAMVAAAFGVIPPIYGAGLQETIDVAVILNALRASR